MSSPPGLHVLRQRFDDIEVFTAAAKDWNLQFRQLDHGPFIGEMDQVMTGSVVVTRCRFNRRIEQLGAAPAGCRTFGVTQPDHVSFRWRKFEIEAGDLLGFAEDVAMDSQSAPGFHLFAVSIGESLLETAAQRLNLVGHEEVLRCEQVVRPPGHLMQELRRFCQAATGFRSPGPAAERVLADGLASQLPELLLQAFQAGDEKLPVPTSLGRRRALRRALEVIREAPEPIQAVTELCRLTGESERMLGYAFKETYGVSPKAYLQARRLNAVRRELLHGGPGTLIVDKANDQGFWHMGQFAADYRKMFSELPSETLRR